MSAPQLSGKVAIVTGASSGIGEAIAIMMAGRGASVALSGRNDDRLKAALQKCVTASGGHPERFLIVSGDITVASKRKNLLDQTVAKFKKLDILVNSAGIILSGTATSTTTEESWDSITDTNLKAIFFLIQAAVPHLEKSKGNIVSISSIWSTSAMNNYIPYAVAKAGLDHMTRCLTLDLGPKGIRVNSVSPSYIQSTDLLRAFPAETTKAVQDRMRASTKQVYPMGELGTKEQVAEVVVFLASGAAAFVSGQNVNATGGSHLLNIVPIKK